MLLLMHGLELADLHPRGLRTLNRAVADFRVRLVANSTFTLQKAQAAGVSGELECCHPSVVLPELESQVKDTQSKRIVTVTRLVERKNLFRAIDAVAALNRKGADLEYWIIGEGPLQGALTDYANTYGGGRVYLLGAVDKPTKWRRLQSADVFVLPSVDSVNGDDFEGYGLALIEANWAGVPVVAGSSGGMPEAVQSGRTGYVSDGTTAGIAECIGRLIDSPPPFQALRDWAARHRAGSKVADSGFFTGEME